MQLMMLMMMLLQPICSRDDGDGVGGCCGVGVGGCGGGVGGVGGCGGGVEAISDEFERSSKKLDNSVPSLQLANERLHRKRKS